MRQKLTFNIDCHVKIRATQYIYNLTVLGMNFVTANFCPSLSGIRTHALTLLG